MIVLTVFDRFRFYQHLINDNVASITPFLNQVNRANKADTAPDVIVTMIYAFFPAR